MIRRISLALAVSLLASLAFGQANNSSTWQTPGGATVPGVMLMCLNGANQSVPCLSSGTQPRATPNNFPTTGNATVGAIHQMCLNANNQAVPC